MDFLCSGENKFIVSLILNFKWFMLKPADRPVNKLQRDTHRLLQNLVNNTQRTYQCAPSGWLHPASVIKESVCNRCHVPLVSLWNTNIMTTIKQQWSESFTLFYYYGSPICQTDEFFQKLLDPHVDRLESRTSGVIFMQTIKHLPDPWNERPRQP